MVPSLILTVSTPASPCSHKTSLVYVKCSPPVSALPRYLSRLLSARVHLRRMTIFEAFVVASLTLSTSGFATALIAHPLLAALPCARLPQTGIVPAQKKRTNTSLCKLDSSSVPAVRSSTAIATCDIDSMAESRLVALEGEDVPGGSSRSDSLRVNGRAGPPSSFPSVVPPPA